MPIGYFVSRVVASYSCASQDRLSRLMKAVIDEALGSSIIGPAAVELIRQPSVFRRLLEKILVTSAEGGANLTTLLSRPVVGVVSSESLPVQGSSVRNYTLAHFVDDYADTLERFLEVISYEEASEYILADVDGSTLDDNIAKRSVNDSMVVLGHTHVPVMHLVPRESAEVSPTPDVLVVNAGAWVADDSGRHHSEYVDILIDDVLDDFPECYVDKNGTDYRGMVHTAANGDPCYAWGSPVRHTPYWDAFGSVAFCRNLGDQARPWCYTGHTGLSWGFCDVGPPRASCPKTYWRGAVRAELYSFPSSSPFIVAERNASSGSRWQVRTLEAAPSIFV